MLLIGTPSYTSTLEDINEGRRILFAKKVHSSSSENLAPTKDALTRHVKRAVNQGGSAL